MNKKKLFMNARTVQVVLIKKNAPVPKGTSAFISPKVFWRNARNHMKTS